MNVNLIVMNKDGFVYLAKYMSVCVPCEGLLLNVREVFVDLRTRRELTDVYMYMYCPNVPKDWRSLEVN